MLLITNNGCVLIAWNDYKCLKKYSEEFDNGDEVWNNPKW